MWFILKTEKFPDYIKPFTIIERKGVKIGIIGLATPTTTLAANPKLLKGLKFLDSAEAANKYIDELKSEKVDIIILLTHLGCSQNLENGEITGEAADLAKKVKDVDLIVTRTQPYNSKWQSKRNIAYPGWRLWKIYWQS